MVEVITTAKKIMSPSMAIAQPDKKLCPAAYAAALPVMGSTPNAIMTNKNGPGFAPNPAMVLLIEFLKASRIFSTILKRLLTRNISNIKGSKYNASTISEIKYKIVIDNQPRPWLCPSNTPAGMPPPIGIEKSKKTAHIFEAELIDNAVTRRHHL